MVDHRAVEHVLQRAVTGLPVAEDELESALVHVESCAVCARRFEVGRGEASTEEKDMAERPVDPTELFERALTAALSEPEAIARRRAAERLGGFERLGLAALSALVRAAGVDEDETVRVAALGALNRLGEDVSRLSEIVWKEDQYWMKLNGLPNRFENSTPVLAIPDWAGEGPVLISAPHPIAGGEVELLLGRPVSGGFPTRAYLLQPRDEG
jgi:hypothetical protein